ncbi:MAG TPA: DUF2652 domain-containing protein [Chryseolinea sp.]|nr:DUF2652 domain-containing protein [Chryseolinea sp.]
MPSTPAIIFIPDISGFTQFMSTLELEHASHIISSFLETIVQQAESKFEVSEIEGDAVLLYRKGAMTSKDEMLSLCTDIFKAFHLQRKSMQQVVLCHCGACQSIINLSVKFIVHAGIISEMKVNRFIKASGVDMIIAHRLLKNGIDSNEYILVTDSFIQQLQDTTDPSGLLWNSSSEVFPSLGKINYQYALLENLKSSIPDPPRYEISYTAQESAMFDLEIEAFYKDVYMTLIDISGRVRWLKGLHKVTTEDHHPSVGSLYRCYFDDVVVEVTPSIVRHMEDEIFYAETIIVEASTIYTVNEYRLRPVGKGCQLSCRILALDGKELHESTHAFLLEGLQRSCIHLKSFCESTTISKD